MTAAAATTPTARQRSSVCNLKGNAFRLLCGLVFWSCISIRKFSVNDSTPRALQNPYELVATTKQQENFTENQDLVEREQHPVTPKPSNLQRNRDRNGHPTYSIFPSCADPSSFNVPSPLTKSNGKFAIAYVVGGCTSESCLTYVLNAVVASRVLQSHQSTIPIFFLVRMASKTPPNARLDTQQETWLQKAGVRLQYLPRVQTENLGTITLEKFRVLEMTEYDRVLFLDSDLIPLCNIDYYFEASYQGLLQGFVGIQGASAPMIASTFMVTPADGLFESLLDIIHKQRGQRERFDNDIGWGHKIAQNDKWTGSLSANNTRWTMHGGPIDQGLLFYFFKYHLLNYSLQLTTGLVEQWQEVPTHWDVSSSGDVVVIEAPNEKFIYVNTTNPHPIERSLHMDFFHYPGPIKPWKQGLNGTEISSLINSSDASQIFSLGRKPFWRYYLGKANSTWDLHLPTHILPINVQAGGGKQWDVHLFDPNIDIPIPR